MGQPVLRRPDHERDQQQPGEAVDVVAGVRLDGSEHRLLQGQRGQQQLRWLEGKSTNLHPNLPTH